MEDKINLWPVAIVDSEFCVDIDDVAEFLTVTKENFVHFFNVCANINNFKKDVDFIIQESRVYVTQDVAFHLALMSYNKLGKVVRQLLIDQMKKCEGSLYISPDEKKRILTEKLKKNTYITVSEVADKLCFFGADRIKKVNDFLVYLDWQRFIDGKLLITEVGSNFVIVDLENGLKVLKWSESDILQKYEECQNQAKRVLKRERIVS